MCLDLNISKYTILSIFKSSKRNAKILMSIITLFCRLLLHRNSIAILHHQHMTVQQQISEQLIKILRVNQAFGECRHRVRIEQCNGPKGRFNVLVQSFVVVHRVEGAVNVELQWLLFGAATDQSGRI